MFVFVMKKEMGVHCMMDVEFRTWKKLSQKKVQLDKIYLPNLIHSVQQLVTSSKMDHICQNNIQ